MYRNFEKLHTDVYALLRSLGVKADHTQFFYTAYAIALVANQPLRGLFFTCMVLRPVAMFYDIPVTTVRDAIHCTAGTFLFADIFSRRAELSAASFVIRLAGYINDKRLI